MASNSRRGSRRLSTGGKQVLGINAAAFQQHLTRNLNLSLVQPKFNRNKKQQKPNVKNQPTHAYRNIWVCEICTLENDASLSACGVCNTLRPEQRLRRQSMPSLAEARGLVVNPNKRLSKDEWAHCEQAAHERGEGSNPCAICHEEFKMGKHVILNCSHIFHHECLQSFERFLRTNQRTCPLCRKSNYQKRYTDQGAVVYKDKCVLRVQAIARGFLARREFRNKLTQYFQQGNGEEKRRHDFFAHKISDASDRWLSAIAVQNDSVDSLLAELDRSVINCRKILAQESPQPENISKWSIIYQKVQTRNETECPICINDFSEDKRNALLSCSHMFHLDCLHAFEAFNIYEVHLCPVCRSTYESLELTCEAKAELAS